MASVNESLGKTDLNSQLKDGLDVLSLNQEVTFTLYNRVVLPIDGYVFLVKADLYNPTSGLFNSSKYNTAYLDQHSIVATAARVITPKGSVHYSTENQQNYDETIAVQTVTFTAQTEIQDFKLIGPDSVYIATFDGIRYAFTERAGYFKQADLYHYRGEAIYPAMLPNVIDDPRQFNNRLVATNSTPIWLGLNQIMPVYPAHLVPQNLPPPYASFEIRDTRGIGAAPFIDGNGNHSQLVRDLVKVTIYGVRNDYSLDYQDYVFDYSLSSDEIGIMNVPVIVDEKRTQSELSIIAIKKSIEFEVNYYQARMKDIARQVILNAGVTIEGITNIVYPIPAFDPKSLFSDGKQGAVYDASDIATLFQDSTGTTPVTAVTQPIGLMLDKHLGPQLGPELVPDTTFDTSTGWILGADWAISGGKLSKGNTGTAEAACSAITLVSGKTYKVTYLQTAGGSINIHNGGANYFRLPASGGVFIAIGTTFALQGGGPCEFESFSIKLLDGNHALQATALARPTWEVGAAGYHYLKFLGVDDSLSCVTGGGGSAGFFFCCAIKPTGGAGTLRTIFSDVGTNTGYKVQIDAADKLSFSAGNGAAYTTLASTATLSVGTTYYLTAWDDGTNLSVQIDGSELNTIARPVVSAGATGFTLCKDNGAASSFLIANVYRAIYVKDYRLTAAQIKNIQDWVSIVI